MLFSHILKCAYFNRRNGRAAESSSSSAGVESSESHTQCDPVFLNTFVDNDFSEITNAEVMQVDAPLQPWCKLICRNSSTPHIELKYLDEDIKRTLTVSSEALSADSNDSNLPTADSNLDETNSTANLRFHVHTIGRSAQCAIKFENYSRISNRHCSIFCKQNLSDPQHPYLEAWIEDTSANGTIINKDRLKKNVPRLLHNGDELNLINPDLVRVANSGVTAEDVAKFSFIVTLDLPTPPDALGEALTASGNVRSGLTGLFNAPENGQNNNNNNNSLTRNNTVHRLLNQNRNISDYYVLKELLGSGAAGLVYRGISKETGRDWAVKVVDTRQLLISSNTSQEITKEAELLRSLRHPNIIHLEDIFASGHNVYLVMELSVGGDLFDRITKKQRYQELEAKEVIRQILEAMAYMHENKVAHRDLKPENILLARKDSDVDIKITDFGLAKKLDDKGGLKSYCGTPQYYAP